jgi:hypothetical protein
MDKEYLEDYQQNEVGEHDKLGKMIADGNFGIDDIFPPEERFIKLSKPIAWSYHKRDIWVQIPFAGSTVVMLYPVHKKYFYYAHGFEISDINALVDFIKETGKVQFIVDWPPTAFEGLDYLEPIFNELNPPTYYGVQTYLPPDDIQLKKARIEFDTLASLGFYQLLKTVFSKEPSGYIQKRMHDYKIDYLVLNKLGLSNLVEYIGNLMVDDPVAASHAYTIIAYFICLPRLNPLKAVHNTDMNLFLEAQKYMSVKTPRFPCEIGKFLLNKLTYYPESLSACKELIAHYRDYDLTQLLTSMNESVTTSNVDLVNISIENISETLDNIWNDSSIKRKIKAIQFGIPLSLTALGTIALGPIGTLGGLLSGLGFSVASELLKIESDTIGEMISKSLSKSYQVNIFNFQKKYKIQ